MALNTFRLTILLAAAFGAYYYFTSTGQQRARRAPAGARTFCNTGGTVAFTLDDGPGAGTNEVLGQLDQAGIKATFHVSVEWLNAVSASRFNLELAFQSGHLIGLRYPNEPSPVKQSPAAFTQTLIQQSKTIYEIIGKYPKYLRLPAGNYDASHVQTAQALGFVVTEWNIDLNDFLPDGIPVPLNTLTDIFQNEFSKLASNNGRYIVLAHDTSKTWTNPSVLPAMVKNVTNSGYKFIRLDECTGNAAYRTSNTAPGTSPPPPPSSDGPVKPTSDARSTIAIPFVSLLLLLFAFLL